MEECPARLRGRTRKINPVWWQGPQSQLEDLEANLRGTVNPMQSLPLQSEILPWGVGWEEGGWVGVDERQEFVMG